jgi:hypothetical protein
MHGDGGITATLFVMTGMKIGYARVSTNDQQIPAWPRTSLSSACLPPANRPARLIPGGPKNTTTSNDQAAGRCLHRFPLQRE